MVRDPICEVDVRQAEMPFGSSIHIDRGETSTSLPPCLTKPSICSSGPPIFHRCGSTGGTEVVDGGKRHNVRSYTEVQKGRKT